MVYFITFFLLLLNLIVYISKRNIGVISLISYAWIFILFYGNTNNPDYSGYLWRYNSQVYNSSMEIGYKFLSGFLHMRGFDYQALILAIILISIPFVLVVICKMNCNLHLLFVMYVVPFFVLDVIQIRNFIASMIFSCAVIMLSEGKKKTYILMVLLSTLFHRSFIVFLIFVFLSEKTQISKKIVRLVFAVTIGICILALVERNVVLLPISYVSKLLLGESEKGIYFGTYINFGFVLYIIAGLCNIMLAWMLVKIINCYEYLTIFGQKYMNRYKIVYQLNMLSCVFFPLLMLNSNFLRLLRNNCFVLIVLTAALLNNEKLYKNKLRKKGLKEGSNYIDKRKYLYKYLYLIILVFMSVWFVANGIDRYYQDVLDNNFILGIGG